MIVHVLVHSALLFCRLFSRSRGAESGGQTGQLSPPAICQGALPPLKVLVCVEFLQNFTLKRGGEGGGTRVWPLSRSTSGAAVEEHLRFELNNFVGIDLHLHSWGKSNSHKQWLCVVVRYGTKFDEDFPKPPRVWGYNFFFKLNLKFVMYTLSHVIFAYYVFPCNLHVIACNRWVITRTLSEQLVILVMLR